MKKKMYESILLQNVNKVYDIYPVYCDNINKYTDIDTLILNSNDTLFIFNDIVLTNKIYYKNVRNYNENAYNKFLNNELRNLNVIKTFKKSNKPLSYGITLNEAVFNINNKEETVNNIKLIIDKNIENIINLLNKYYTTSNKYNGEFSDNIYYNYEINKYKILYN